MGHDGREGCRAKRRIRLAEEVLQTEAQVRRERELQNFVSELCQLLTEKNGKRENKGRPNPFDRALVQYPHDIVV